MKTNLEMTIEVLTMIGADFDTNPCFQDPTWTHVNVWRDLGDGTLQLTTFLFDDKGNRV